ncbi:hypothetical protein BH09PAT4_BH09PAT4_08040 [soil metagenome]
MSEQSPEFSTNLPAFQECLRSIESFVADAGRPYHFRSIERPQTVPAASRADCDLLARVGSVLVEDASARVPGTPIMYDVHIFTESGQQKAGLAARLTKQLEQFEKMEVLDFTMSGEVRRSFMDNTYATQESHPLSASEVDLLAEQLATLGSIGRVL